MKCMLAIIMVLILYLIILSYKKWNEFQSNVAKDTLRKKMIPSEIRIRILEEMYRKIADLFLSNDIQYWLYSGTLLGYIREKEIICYDYDNDIALFYKDHNKVKQLLKEFVANNTEYEFRNHYYPLKLGCFMEIIHKGTRLTTDLGFWYKNKNTLHRGLPLKIFMGKAENEIPLDKILPLKRVTFMGRDTFIPNDSDFVLKRLYGADYMTPSMICDEKCNNCSPNSILPHEMQGS